MTHTRTISILQTIQESTYRVPCRYWLEVTGVTRTPLATWGCSMKKLLADAAISCVAWLHDSAATKVAEHDMHRAPAATAAAAWPTLLHLPYPVVGSPSSCSPVHDPYGVQARRTS